MIDLLSLGTITSPFGERDSPTGGASSNHKGIDIVLTDYNIPAVTSGKVTASGYSDSAGYYITILSDDNYSQTYMHMANKSKVHVGSYVWEGTTIGKQGSTGISTGDHLHFEVTDESGTYINPETYLKYGTNTPPPSSGKEEQNSVGLEWWGDIVKVVLCGLLILGGSVMLIMGVKDTALRNIL